MAFREGKGYNVVNGGHEQHQIQALRVSRLWGPPQAIVVKVLLSFDFALEESLRWPTSYAKLRTSPYTS